MPIRFLQLFFLVMLTIGSPQLYGLIPDKDEKPTKEESTAKEEEEEKPAAKEEEETKEEEPPKIGNFALPTSQQPAGLFAFGGNIIDKGEVQLYLFADKFVGRKKITIDIDSGCFIWNHRRLVNFF